MRQHKEKQVWTLTSDFKAVEDPVGGEVEPLHLTEDAQRHSPRTDKTVLLYHGK